MLHIYTKIRTIIIIMLSRGISSNVDAHIAHQMKKRRKQLGITQKSLAESLGVTFQQIQKYENGSNRVSASKLYQIAERLNTTVSYFFQEISESPMLSVNEEAAKYDGDHVPDKELKYLASHYKKIKNEKLRKKVLDLVKCISA